MLHWVNPCYMDMLPLPHGFFLKIIPHRDMKILKILASNSMRLRFYDILKNDKLMIGSGGSQTLLI